MLCGGLLTSVGRLLDFEIGCWLIRIFTCAIVTWLPLAQPGFPLGGLFLVLDLLILALVIVIRWIIADALGVLELFDLSERGADAFAHLVFESLNQVLHCLGVVHGLNRTR